MASHLLLLAILGTYHGEYARGGYWIDANTTATPIAAINQWHAGFGFTSAPNHDVDFLAGGQASITSFADYGGTVAGTVKATTSTSHGLTTGDPVTITGSGTPYPGIFGVTVIDADEFYFTATWTTDGTGTVTLPDRLQAGPRSGGNYVFHATGSGSSASANQTFDFHAFVNLEDMCDESGTDTGSCVRATVQTANDFLFIGGGGTIPMAAGDVWWFAVRNNTSAADVLLRNVTVVIEKSINE